MTNAPIEPFIPVLTVMVDYGNAPFLWLRRSADDQTVGGLICDGVDYDDDCPMSEGLWREFTPWACAFDGTEFYRDDYVADDWDWLAFHARGLQLAHRLKQEVGETHRVIYDKPVEDPNMCMEERREIFLDGTLQTLFTGWEPADTSLHFCRHILADGQTGASRAALDFAIRHHYTHGGWAPRQRVAEDGPIPAKYQLTSLPDAADRPRAQLNVQDSDATLIVASDPLDDDTLATRDFAQQLGKPCFIVPLNDNISVDSVTDVLNGLHEHGVVTLHITGASESQHPGAYQLTLALLEAMASATHCRQQSGSPS